MGNVSQPQPRYATREGPEYSNKAEAQDLKINYIKMIEVLKKKIHKSLKEIPDNTNNWRKLISQGNPKLTPKANK